MDMAVAVEEVSTRSGAGSLTLAPNPCRDNTTFRFQVPIGTGYAIRIFDVTGRPVRGITGVTRDRFESVGWDCRDDRGETVGSGIYFYRIECPALKTTGKIIVR